MIKISTTCNKRRKELLQYVSSSSASMSAFASASRSDISRDVTEPITSVIEFKGVVSVSHSPCSGLGVPTTAGAKCDMWDMTYQGNHYCNRNYRDG